MLMSLKARQCLLDRNASHPLVFHGDSVLKLVFDQSVDILGLGISDKKIYHLNNRPSDEIVMSYEMNMKNGDLATALVTTWTANTDVRSLDALLPQRYPFLFQTDFSLYHFYQINTTAFAASINNADFFKVWNVEELSSRIPVKIFQTTAHMYMEYSDLQSIEAYRRRNRILRDRLLRAGFEENEQWYYTAGILNREIHFQGSPRKMGTMITFNMMCNTRHPPPFSQHQQHRNKKKSRSKNSTTATSKDRMKNKLRSSTRSSSL